MNSNPSAAPRILNGDALVRSIVYGGLFVPLEHGVAVQAPPFTSSQIASGSQILGASAVRALHVVKDIDVYLLSRQEGFSALKIQRLSPDGACATSVRARLQHEAAFLSTLNGVLAPKLLDKGEWDGRFYVEMEFIEGAHAATAAALWRERGGAKGRQMLLRLAKTIARAYAALHKRGILHGDIHPDNVLIRRDGTVVLLDFGVARPAVSQTSLPTPVDRPGRAFFFEPEMARVALAGLPSMPASQSGEQHAVATLLYFLMTGAHWQNFRLGRDAMLEDIATLHPLSFRKRGVESWPELEAVLGRALSKLPEARFPSMSAFAGELDAVTVAPGTPSVSRALPFSKFVEQALADPAFTAATSFAEPGDYQRGRAPL
jgi:serine/threonine protein kinase